MCAQHPKASRNTQQIFSGHVSCQKRIICCMFRPRPCLLGNTKREVNVKPEHYFSHIMACHGIGLKVFSYGFAKTFYTFQSWANYLTGHFLFKKIVFGPLFDFESKQMAHTFVSIIEQFFNWHV